MLNNVRARVSFLLLLVIFGFAEDDVLFHSQIFPKSIPLYPHRKDHHTGELVTRGRLHLIGGLSPIPQNSKVSSDELRKILQCAVDEPDLVGDRGTLYLTKLAPPTRETVRLMAVWAETGCDTWSKCHDELQKFDEKVEGRGTGGSRGAMNSPFRVKLLRITNGTLYSDWPFSNKERFGKTPLSNKYALLHLVLGKVTDIGDAVFFFGEEVAYLPYHFPFFGFSASPTMKNADMPWPWLAHQVAEANLYKSYAARASPSQTQPKASDIIYQMNQHGELFNNMSVEIWRQKKPKAAFYGAMSSLRHTFFSVATANPDLFDFGWTGAINSHAWNPLSSEKEIPYDDLKAAYEKRDPNFHTPGYLQTLLPSHLFEGHGVNYLHADGTMAAPTDMYKYLVVLIGGSNYASADRLASMMIHSGAVLLIQKHEFEYHFSSRLRPWVHFVPLTYTTTDIVDKIRWLQQNDHLAHILAKNARAFALSHLRIEDVVCYATSALQAISSVLNHTTATEPFEPIPIPFETL